MRRVVAVVCATLAAAMAFAGVAHATTPSQQPRLPIVVPFSADSSDSCGHTEGSLAWFVGVGPIADPEVVTVGGVVVDPPAGNDKRCLPEPPALLTKATFTAFAGRVVIDGQVQFADNGSVEFKFDLTDAFPLPGDAPLDRIVVQVCRIGVEVDFAVCGTPQEYLRPPVV